MAELPRAPLKRLFQQVGADRVSASALEALAEHLEDYARDLAERSWQLARHAGRKTVKREDVRAAK